MPISLSALLLGACLLQEPAPELPAAPTPPLAGQLGDRAITVAEYQEFLWQRFGRRALREYADLLLLREACERFATPLADGELERAVDERLGALRGELDAAAFAEQLRRGGLDEAQLRASLRLEAERDLRATRLVRATRVATDARLRTLFEQQYGPGGVRVEVAHLLFMPNHLRAARIRAGARPDEIDPLQLDQEALDLAEAALAELQAGADFAALARERSHDQSTREQGGRLQAWRPGLYGDAFAELVAGLEPGALGAQVVRSGAGYHVVRLLGRTTTDFAAVRAELVAAYMASEPDWQEKDELVAGLREETPLELP